MDSEAMFRPFGPGRERWLQRFRRRLAIVLPVPDDAQSSGEVAARAAPTG